MDTEPIRLFLEDFRKPLLVLHALFAFAATGSSFHHLAALIQYQRGSTIRNRLEKLHSRILPAAYVATVALGLLTYPTYRYRVRAAYFDSHLPRLSNWFDLKEAWGAVGLPLVLAIAWIGPSFDPKNDRSGLPFYLFLSGATALIVLFNVVSGLAIVSYRAV
ncbi:MAG: hypothetical protein HYT87_09695 [Nitrospirae bacterium]|nr:hypothetical protein [Nitrospirota bacterium]